MKESMKEYWVYHSVPIDLLLTSTTLVFFYLQMGLLSGQSIVIV